MSKVISIIIGSAFLFLIAIFVGGYILADKNGKIQQLQIQANTTAENNHMLQQELDKEQRNHKDAQAKYNSLKEAYGEQEHLLEVHKTHLDQVIQEMDHLEKNLHRKEDSLMLITDSLTYLQHDHQQLKKNNTNLNIDLMNTYDLLDVQGQLITHLENEMTIQRDSVELLKDKLAQPPVFRGQLPAVSWISHLLFLFLCIIAHRQYSNMHISLIS